MNNPPPCLSQGLHEWPGGVEMATEVLDYRPIEDVLEEFAGEYTSYDTSDYAQGTFLLRLKYTVTVPSGLPEPVDVWNCPGQLSSLNGSGESVRAMSFLGDESPTVELWDPIFPGGSKFGVATYVISPDVVEDELILRSFCGGEEEKIYRESIAPIQATE